MKLLELTDAERDTLDKRLRDLATTAQDLWMEMCRLRQEICIHNWEEFDLDEVNMGKYKQCAKCYLTENVE